MNPILTIAIPTFNRAVRLEETLNKFCKKLMYFEYRGSLEVLVSDNGSDDQTNATLIRFHELFSNLGVKFLHLRHSSNMGFDENVSRCYRAATGKYVWFFSDDDNFYTDSIEKIMGVIESKKPSVMFFNFDQMPYNIGNPLIKEELWISEINEENIGCLRIVSCTPKLSSMVVEKIALSLISPAYPLGFTHVEIFFRIALMKGRAFFSTEFIGYPDADYRDHIDFLPHIANSLNEQLKIVLKEFDVESAYPLLCDDYTDPLSSCLNTLGCVYRKKIKTSENIRRKLWETIKAEFSLRRLLEPKVAFEAVKFCLSITVLRK